MTPGNSGRDYWQRQTLDTPLHPNMLWSRPENRLQAGKLLIIGGNAHGFACAAEAYRAATAAGIGTARMLLPDSLQKLVGRVFEAGEYAPSTPSGSFSTRALAEAVALGSWADGVLIAGDLGRNSETAVLLEKFVAAHHGQITLTRDAADYFTSSPLPVLTRPNTLLVISLAQLQKIAVAARYKTAFTYTMDMLRFVDALHEFSSQYPAAFIVRHLDTLFVATGGSVSSTRVPTAPDASEPSRIWRVHTAAAAATWWLQNPDKTYEALSTSLIDSGETY